MKLKFFPIFPFSPIQGLPSKTDVFCGVENIEVCDFALETYVCYRTGAREEDTVNS